VLPDEERLFNPSRETRALLRQAQEIGVAAHQLCQTLFAAEGRVGQRKLWGIVGLAKRYPSRLVEQACQRALDEGIQSYKRIKALTEQLTTQALEQLNTPAQTEPVLTQQHPLIRDGQDYADLFTLGAQQSASLPLFNED
ncbi:IS21 family transposase, partial [Eoetvoesiella caeni]